MPTMPEAPMNKDHFVMLWEDNIGTTREFSPMKAKPVPHAVEQRSDCSFWAGVFRRNAAHDR
jgi:hypothetical protein